MFQVHCRYFYCMSYIFIVYIKYISGRCIIHIWRVIVCYIDISAALVFVKSQHSRFYSQSEWNKSVIGSRWICCKICLCHILFGSIKPLQETKHWCPNIRTLYSSCFLHLFSLKNNQKPLDNNDQLLCN